MDSLSESPTARVSVIIPAFNDQTGVHVCLKAIAAQTYPLDAIEVIVVDNGSTPPLSLSNVYPFTTRLIQCITPGSYAARNAGVKAAVGQALAFIDADCWPDRDWLARGVCSLFAGTGRSIIGGEVSILRPDKPTAIALYQYATGFGQESNVRDKGFSATANLFCTAEQFAVVGPFDERLLSGGDREWSWRAAQYGIGLQYEPKAAIYTQPRVSLCVAIRQARRIVAGRMMLRKLGLAHIGDAAVSKQRSAWQAIMWVLSNTSLTLWDRLRVLCAAIVIRGVSALERCRLELGANAERR